MFEPTYEELKDENDYDYLEYRIRFEPTYEELKACILRKA